jgi:hypothetical protein
MHLTAKALVELIRSLKSNYTSHQRQEPRIGLRAPAWIVLPRGQIKPLRVWIRDISSSGVGIVSAASISVGEIFTLLVGDDSSSAESIICTAIQCRKVATQLFHVGAQPRVLE